MAKTNSSVSKTGKSAEVSAQEKIVQLKKDEIALDTEIVRNAKRKVEILESIEKSGKKLSNIQLKEIEYAKQDINLQEDKEKALKTEQQLLSKLYKTENKRKKLLKDSITDTDEFASSLRSLGVQIGKDNKLFEAMNSHVDSVGTTLNSVGQIVAELGDDQQNLKRQVIGASDAYKNLNTNITFAGKKLMQQNMTQSEYNELVKQSYENLDESISKIDQSTEAGRELYKIMSASKKEMESFYKAAQKSSNTLKGMDAAMGQFSGVPMMKEFGDVVKSATEGGGGMIMALGALGAAAGALAYNYGLVGDKVGDMAKYDKTIVGLTADIDVANQKLEMGMFGGRNFVAEKAMNAIKGEMLQMAASFQAASKTALFGKGLGSVGYGAAQLEMAGISAETIASGMQAAANETGKMPSAKVGADMAIMAARTGQSAEGIASINEAFMRMDGVSEKTALNMQEGVRAMADKAGVNLGGVIEEMAGASKEMLGYQIKSGSALAKQVIFAKSMGVSFNEITKAGRGMVLNYKDSIKAEMSLSAMLGKNVDLSEVRAKFASGDTDGAIKALKAQGLDPGKMDMFQQEQLMQTIPGMDLTTFDKIFKNKGKEVDLGTGDAKAGNETFLSAKSSAQIGLQMAQAMISAKTQLADTLINKDLEQAKQTALMLNTGGLNALTVALNQENLKKDAEIAAKTGGFALGGGAIGAGLGYVGNKLMSKGAGKVPTGAVDDIAKVGDKGAGMVSKLGNVGKIAGKLLGKVAAPLAIAMSLYDGFKGFTADADASTGEKFKNAGSSILNGLTFGLLGKDSDEIAADAIKRKGGVTPGNTSVATTISNSEKFLQDKLTYMSGNLERVVDRTNRTMINTAATTKELTTLNTNTKAILNLTKQIEALTVATYTGAKTAVRLSIDGKQLATSYNRYTENTKNTNQGNPSTKTNR